MRFLNLQVLFPGGQGQRLEAHPATMEELPEDLVVMQTHRLDADDQSFKTDNEQVTQQDGNPKPEVRFLPRQRKDRQAQASMRYGKGAHTDKGKCIAKEADD